MAWGLHTRFSPWRHLFIFLIITIGLVLIVGSGGGGGDGGGGDDGGGDDGGGDDALDQSERLLAAKADFQRLQCDCAVQSGAYSSIAECEADLFKLEPIGNDNEQCLRDVISANLEENSNLECELVALEDLSDCTATASCSDDIFATCLTELERQLSACPGPVGDSLVIDYSSGDPDLSSLLEPGVVVDLPQAEAFFAEDKFNLDASSVSFPPTFSTGEIVRLNGGVLADVSGPLPIGYDLNVTGFGVTLPDTPSSDDRIFYSITGTLNDAIGGDPAGFDGAELNIFYSSDRTLSAGPIEMSGNAIRSRTWEASGSYSIANRPDSAEDVFIEGLMQLTVSDSFFEEALESCQNLPGDQLVAFYNESLDTAYEELCQCADELETIPGGGESCRDPKQSPRPDCLEALLDISPLVAEYTECLIADLDTAAEELPELACRISDPGCTDCVQFDADSNSWISPPEIWQTNGCGASPAITEAFQSCLGPLPPPPVDFSDDPARCTPTQDMLASGNEGDVMVVSLSQKLNPDSVPPFLPFSRHYVILQLDQLAILQQIPLDTIQQSLFALYLLDGDPTRDQCEMPGIVSIAFDDPATVPDFDSINTQIAEIRDALGQLPARIQEGQEQAEAAADELYNDLICGAVGDNYASPPGVGFWKGLLLKQLLLGATGCL